jgi:drug/metabolite transporter (DMT)-like permease
MTDVSRRHWIGIGLVLLSAVCFSATSASAVISYKAAANPIAVITIRFLGGIILLSLLLKFTGAPLVLPSRDRWLALGLGVLLAGQSFFLYSSFELIPVGLTMIIFYIYPLMVAMVESLIGHERLSPAIWGALALAFIGLVLVLNVTGDGLDTLGATYAVIAGLGWGCLTILSSRVMKGGDARAVTLHMQIGGAITYLLVCLITLDVALPATTKGWAAFMAMPVFYTIAVTAFFAAVAVTGSVRASLFMNIEPVVTICFGFVILGQVLAPYQLLGAALVVGAIVGVRWEGMRKAAPG